MPSVPPGSGVAGERTAPVVGDHVAQGRDDVDRRPSVAACQFQIGAVQVTDDAFGVGQRSVGAEVGLACGVER